MEHTQILFFFGAPAKELYRTLLLLAAAVIESMWLVARVRGNNNNNKNLISHLSHEIILNIYGLYHTYYQRNFSSLLLNLTKNKKKI